MSRPDTPPTRSASENERSVAPKSASENNRPAARRSTSEHRRLSTLPLRIIPVIDVSGGVVVWAAGGNRELYAPLESPLAPTSEPPTIARALADRVGHRELYVADLDAIAGAEPAWAIHQDLLSANFDLWLDTGLTNRAQAAAVAELHRVGKRVHRIIAALESLPNMQLLEDLVTFLGGERLAFSLDLRAGEPCAKGAALQGIAPLALVEEAISLGLQRLIVLDLQAVGTRQGPPNLGLLQEIRARFPQIELIAGGGVRGRDDLVRLCEAGCDAALVSTWLHRLP